MYNLTRPTFSTAILAGIASGSSAQSPSWPARPIRLIVPFAAGGNIDNIGRLLADRMGALLGQPFIVDNRPGAGGNLGADLAVRSAPDGYTLLLSGFPVVAVNPHLMKNSPFDPIRDLAHVALLATAPNLLVVNPSLPIKTVQDLIAMARRTPGALSFSSAGNGTSGHLAGEMFKRQTQIDVQHVPYKGQADAITALIRGDVAFAFVTLAGTLGQVNAGRLRAIAISAKARSSLAPDVPTVIEAGFPDFDVLAWYSVAAPKATPQDIVLRLAAAIDKILQEGPTRDKMGSLGSEAQFLTGDKLVDFMIRDSERWGKIIRDAGISAT